MGEEATQWHLRPTNLSNPVVFFGERGVQPETGVEGCTAYSVCCLLPPYEGAGV